MSFSPVSMMFSVVAALVFGVLAGGWLERSRARAAAEAAGSAAELVAGRLRSAEAQNERAQAQLMEASAQLAAAQATAAARQQAIERFERDLAEMRERRDQLAREQQELRAALAAARTSLDAEREKPAFFAEAKKELSSEFKSLASDILEEKARRFATQNQENLGHLLSPLARQLQDFQQKVTAVHEAQLQGSAALGEQVRHLTELNQRISAEANNLATALKGSSKTQGDWGELILETVLEASGLRAGYEYRVQQSYSRDGSRGRPDVIINLPEGRHLVIDAKVSLLAYEESCSAEDDRAREAAVARHLASARAHIKELSQRDYQGLYQLKSLDFVLMFVPIEPAFMLTIGSDSKLWQQAWEKNVLLVSPSTLLFVVRTVAHLWRQERQNQSVQEIVKRGEELYNKLVGFVDDLQDVGERLAQAQKGYDSAFSRLATGKGNVIRQAEMLKALGVRPSKSLPQGLVETAQQEALDLDPVEPDNPLGLPG